MDINWILAVISLSGNIFNVKKKVACFYIWGIGEIFWLILDFSKGVYGRAFLDLVQLGMAIWGIVSWSKEKEGDKNAEKKFNRTSTRNFKDSRKARRRTKFFLHNHF